MRRSHHIFSLLLSISALGGCLRATQVSIAQKTTLERQIIGELEPLDEEQILAASIRAVRNTDKNGALSSLRERAITARRRQLFNRDDVESLLLTGCLGEGSHGLVVARTCAAEQRELQQQMTKQENDDRHAIVAWVIENDAALTPADGQRILALYAELRRAQLKRGMWFQDNNKGWQVFAP